MEILPFMSTIKLRTRATEYNVSATKCKCHSKVDKRLHPWPMRDLFNSLILIGKRPWAEQYTNQAVIHPDRMLSVVYLKKLVRIIRKLPLSK